MFTIAQLAGAFVRLFVFDGLLSDSGVDTSGGSKTKTNDVARLPGEFPYRSRKRPNNQTLMPVLVLGYNSKLVASTVPVVPNWTISMECLPGL